MFSETLKQLQKADECSIHPGQAHDRTAHAQGHAHARIGQGHQQGVLPAVRDLSPPGDLVQTEKYGFEFNDVEMQYDSYRGLQVRLRSVPAPVPTPHAFYT